MTTDKADLLTLLRSLADGVRGMGLGDPDAGERVEADDVVRWAADEIERLSRPAAWQEEQAAVESAFERSGVARTWPSDEPDQIIPMVTAMAREIERLREAIRRLADQDATLSVCDGAVTVTMDATLTNEEREAVRLCAGYLAINERADLEATLRGLLERTGGNHG